MNELAVKLDYKVIVTLYKQDTPLKVGDLTKKLQLAHSTIGSCIKRLEEKSLVEYEAYHDVELTLKGKNLAKELIRHRQLVEILFYNELGLSPQEAHQESKKLNLLFSCNLINKICEKYNHPKKCPCGEKVVNSEYCHCEEEIIK
ncbi:MAG: metal-dependent transcriptional regulator [Promethearchaeia archaeon]